MGSMDSRDDGENKPLLTLLCRGGHHQFSQENGEKEGRGGGGKEWDNRMFITGYNIFLAFSSSWKF